MAFISFVFLNGVLGFDFLLKIYHVQLMLLILEVLRIRACYLAKIQFSIDTWQNRVNFAAAAAAVAECIFLISFFHFTMN